MVKKDVFIPWDDRYSVGVNIIDEQHKELLHLTNELYNTCKQGEEFSREAFQRAAKVAVDYVGKHFFTEEKIMDTVKYPNMVAHKTEHKNFVKRVLANVKDFEEGRNFVPNNFVRFLKDWILSHVAMTDKGMGDYLLVLKKEGKVKFS